MNFFRYFDLEHWQMREALGYPIPNWVDRRWPRRLQGNAGRNPFHVAPPRVSADKIAMILAEECPGADHIGFVAVKLATMIEAGEMRPII